MNAVIERPDDEPDAQALIEMKAISQGDQWYGDAVTQARCVAAYYKRLITDGVPAAVAGKLTGSWQDSYFQREVVMGGFMTLSVDEDDDC